MNSVYLCKTLVLLFTSGVQGGLNDCKHVVLICDSYDSVALDSVSEFLTYLFSDACEILDKAECSESPDKRYTDPCNCYDTYFCLNYQVLTETCAEGTAFNGKRCDHEDKVLIEDCDIDQPWLRCNVSGKHGLSLQSKR